MTSASIENLIEYGQARQWWLSAAVAQLRPRFATAGYGIPGNLRVGIGWPKGAKGRKGESDTIGQCFPPNLSQDGHFEVFVSPVVDTETRLLDVLAHELCHAVTPGDRHGKRFRRAALAVGLVGPMRSTTGGDDFNNWVRMHVVPAIGPYPAAPIKLLEERKQTTRLIKCACGVCGYPVRVTRQWLATAGPPLCPTDLIAMGVNESV